jgi:hypothetical protein
VQKEIRYFGIEEGIGSHKPHDPSIVFDRGYGDCKDRVYLLHTIFNRLGILSYPALVSATFKGHFESFIPSADLFDHVILVIHLNGKSYWVDPTASHDEGPLSSIICSQYKKGLILNKGSKALEEIPKDTESTCEVYTSYRLLGDRQPIEVTVDIHHYGVSAHAVRELIKHSGSEEFGNIMLSPFKLLYGEIESIQKLQVFDQLESNHLSFVYQFKIKQPWKMSRENPKKMETVIIPLKIAQWARHMSLPMTRNSPIQLEPTASGKEVIEVIGAKPNQLSINNYSYEDEAVSFKREVSKSRSGQVSICYLTKIKNEMVPKDKVKLHLNMIQDMVKSTPIFIKSN